MIDINEAALELATEEIEEMADDLDDTTKKRGSNSLFEAIERSVDNNILNPALNKAREYARQHVGDRADEIYPVGGSWQGNTYQAGLDTDNEAVLAHEFGSGQYTTTGPYRIYPNSAEKLAFRIDGRPIVVDYVVHPGVRGKRFMQRAMRETSDRILQDAAEEVQGTLDDAL